MRNLALTFESGDDLDVRSFTVLEAMSSCFQIDVVARGREDVDLRAVTGHPAAFAVRRTAGRTTWTGVCAASRSIGGARGLSTYALRVVPALWLSHRVDHIASSSTSPCRRSWRSSSPSGTSSRRSG